MKLNIWSRCNMPSTTQKQSVYWSIVYVSLWDFDTIIIRGNCIEEGNMYVWFKFNIWYLSALYLLCVFCVFNRMAGIDSELRRLREGRYKEIENQMVSVVTDLMVMGLLWSENFFRKVCTEYVSMKSKSKNILERNWKSKTRTKFFWTMFLNKVSVSDRSICLRSKYLPWRFFLARPRSLTWWWGDHYEVSNNEEDGRNAEGRWYKVCKYENENEIEIENYFGAKPKIEKS